MTEFKFRNDDDSSIKVIKGFKVNTNSPARVVGEDHGCGYGCRYCNQMSLDMGENGEKIAGALCSSIDGGVSINPVLYFGKKELMRYNTSELLAELKKYPYWTPSAPLILYNFSDPSLNWKDSISLAKRLVLELKQTGPIQFITKGAINDAGIQDFKDLQSMGGHPIVIVTYSGMPREIEPIPGITRIKTIEKLKKAGIPVIMSMRPMILGINGNDDQIEQTLTNVAHLPDILTVGGLYVYQPATVEAFAKAGFPLPEPYKSWKYPIRKIIPEGYRDHVRDMAGRPEIGIKVHNHTSCAAAELMTTEYQQPMPDSFAHWAGDKKDVFGY